LPGQLFCAELPLPLLFVALLYFLLALLLSHPFMRAAFSLSRALQLGLPAHLSAIEEVSEYASKVQWQTH
jgi:hypothetical protein